MRGTGEIEQIDIDSLGIPGAQQPTGMHSRDNRIRIIRIHICAEEVAIEAEFFAHMAREIEARNAQFKCAVFVGAGEATTRLVLHVVPAPFVGGGGCRGKGGGFDGYIVQCAANEAGGFGGAGFVDGVRCDGYAGLREG